MPKGFRKVYMTTVWGEEESHRRGYGEQDLEEEKAFLRQRSKRTE